MSISLNARARSVLAPLAAVVLLTGCRSVTTLQLYNGPELPPEQLATLVVPYCVALRTLDGMPVPLTLANETRLIVGPGAHWMEARYSVLFPTQGNDTEKIVSDYVRVTFTGEPGKTYAVCSKDPETLDKARRYAAHVSLWVEEVAAGPAEPAVVQTSAPLVPPTTGQAAVPGPAAPKAAGQEASADIQAQLLQLWQKAGDQDRKAFLEKIHQQP